MVSEQWLRACKAAAQLLPVDRFLLSSSTRAGMRTRTLAQDAGGLNHLFPQVRARFVNPVHELQVQASLQKRTSKIPQTKSTVRGR